MVPFAGWAMPVQYRGVKEEHLAVRAAAGVFDPRAVAQLWRKCRAHAGADQFSNADNMAVIGVLSTQILHDRFVRRCPAPAARVSPSTVVDRLAPGARA